MMRLFKMTLVTLMIVLVGVPLLSCASATEAETLSENQMVTVERGNLKIDITAVGNLALSHTEDLAFEMSGTVEEVLVEEGDSVEEGQVLARLDTSEWEEQVSTLEDQVTAAERQVTTKERDLLQAEINLKNTENALEKAQTTYTVSDFEVAQADIDEARRNLTDALLKLSKYPVGTGGWALKQNVVLQAQVKLDATEDKLVSMLAGFDTEEVAIRRLQFELSQAKLDDAQVAIEDAQKRVLDAEADMYEAKRESPVITAPFAGFVTTVNVAGGDEIKKGTVAVQLADPDKFEADVMVGEMDILQVKLGGAASVQVDAMTSIILPATVTHISPTATIQSGVVNYRVKVEIESLQPVAHERAQAQAQAPSELSLEGLIERLDAAAKAGRIPPEQAEQMKSRLEQLNSNVQAGNISPEQLEQIVERFRQRLQSGGGGPQGAQRGAQQGRQPGVRLEDIQLRQGLTVTVSILVDERNNVLLVPNKAITRRGDETTVQVVLLDNTLEKRPIETGISDWQNTEVTAGLSEGEKIALLQANSSASTQSSQGQRGGLGFIFGGRGGGGSH